MFGFGLKHRTREVLLRASYALMTGPYVPQSEIEEWGKSEMAGAYLFYRTMGHCLFVLHDQFESSIANDKPWATKEFFFESVLTGISRGEQELGLEENSIAREIFPEFYKLQLANQEHPDEDLYERTALLVKASTKCTSQEIINMLSQVVEDYETDIEKMFTPR